MWCGKRSKRGLLVLLVLLLVWPASLWADVTLTDAEWEELKTQVQVLMNENSELKSELETLKSEQESMQREYETALRLRDEQLKTLTAQLAESTKLSEKRKRDAEVWRIVGLISTGLVTGAGVVLWLR